MTQTRTLAGVAAALAALAALALALVLLAGRPSPASVGQGTVAGASVIGHPDCAAGLELTYLANEGVLLRGDGAAVLIDALFREGVEPYPTLGADLRARLEGAAAPFDAVDWVLATHAHADHFDGAAVVAHLRSNRRARFISTAAAVEAVRRELAADAASPRDAGPGGAEGRHGAGDVPIAARLTVAAPREGSVQRVGDGRARIDALALHHGRDREIENLGFLIRMAGRTVLHVGDTEATADDLAALDLPSLAIDLALLPTWFVFNEPWTAALPAIGARRIALVHIPEPSYRRGFVARHGGWDGVFEFLAAHEPPVIPLVESLDRRCLGPR